MARILIIGFGNPLRSDDGLGWHVAQLLSRELNRADVQVIAAHQLTPELAESASHAERLIFVDASRTGKPGTQTCQPVTPGVSLNRHSHDLSPSAVLELARELYGRFPLAHLLTITGASFETGETMSPAVIAAIPALVAQVRHLIDFHLDLPLR